MRYSILAVSMSLVSVLILGCEGISYYSETVKESDIYGLYHAGFGAAESDYIELLADSTYIHHFEDDSGNVFVDTGKYQFIERRERSYNIRFTEFKKRHRQARGCYSTKPTAVIDTTATMLKVPFYRIGNLYVIEYCPLDGQAYERRVKEKNEPS